MVPWNGLVMVFLLSALIPTCVTAQKNPPWKIKVKKLQKKGVQLDCSQSKGRIVELDLIGRDKTSKCHGLTADMFVQTLDCLWAEKCELKMKKDDKYMLKLFKGTPDQCITKTAKSFDLSYHCTANDVKVWEVLAGEGTEAVTEEQGIIRSHGDHPWLYTPNTNNTLTLNRPQPEARNFYYKILSLRLTHKDALIVTNVTGQERSSRAYVNDVTNEKHVIKGAESVIFELETSSFSAGGEGFVICFQWLPDSKSTDDACAGLITPGKKPWKKGKGKRKKGPKNANKAKKGEAGGNKNKKRKRKENKN